MSILAIPSVGFGTEDREGKRGEEETREGEKSGDHAGLRCWVLARSMFPAYPIFLYYCALVSVCVYDRGKGGREAFATQRFGGKDTLGRLGSPSQLLVGDLRLTTQLGLLAS